jgi:hypothetical protein
MVAALGFLVGHPCQYYTENNIRVSPLEQTPTCKHENALQFFLLAISLFCSHALQDSSASTALNTHVRRLRSTKLLQLQLQFLFLAISLYSHALHKFSAPTTLNAEMFRTLRSTKFVMTTTETLLFNEARPMTKEFGE